MSMLDSFFNKGFKGAKCKTLLKLSIPRIKLLRNRREIQIKQMRRDIAKLLETGQEATARIRVEHIIREENMMAAQEILELYCELIAVRLPIIETQRECPLDLKEAISSLCFAAPRCADLPELLQVQILFVSKYGKEFVSAATELMPDCGVNRQLIELLSVRAPAPEVKLKLLKEIAEEHELDWDPAASETEFFKPHEDLLNGPTQFITGSKLPLPKEKHDETLYSAPDQAPNVQSNSDTGFGSLDFPEVPRVSLRSSANAASAPEMVPPIPAVTHPEVNDESSKHSGASENPSHEPHLEPEEVVQARSVGSKYESPNISVGAMENKQFIPFISPPSLSSISFSVNQSNHPVPSLSRTKSEADVDLQDVLAAAQAAAESAERAAAAARSAASLAQIRITELTKKKNDQVSENSCENPFHSDIYDESASKQKQHFDHQNSMDDGISNSPDPHRDHEIHPVSDVPDLPSYDTPKVEFDSSVYTDHVPQHVPVSENSCENPFHTDMSDESATKQKQHFDLQNSMDDSISDGISYSPDPHRDHENHPVSDVPDLPSYDTPKVEFDSSVSTDHVPPRVLAHHQPQRLSSMDDDPYFYPNLFTSQEPNLGSGVHSSADNSRSTQEL